MQDVHFLEVTRRLHPFDQLLPLTLKHIDLQVLVQVVDQEAHVLA